MLSGPTENWNCKSWENAPTRHIEHFNFHSIWFISERTVFKIFETRLLGQWAFASSRALDRKLLELSLSLEQRSSRAKKKRIICLLYTPSFNVRKVFVPFAHFDLQSVVNFLLNTTWLYLAYFLTAMTKKSGKFSPIYYLNILSLLFDCNYKISGKFSLVYYLPTSSLLFDCNDKNSGNS